MVFVHLVIFAMDCRVRNLRAILIGPMLYHACFLFNQNCSLTVGSVIKAVRNVFYSVGVRPHGFATSSTNQNNLLTNTWYMICFDILLVTARVSPRFGHVKGHL